MRRRVDPGVSPATFGANQKSEGRSSVVTALMESVIKELKNDIPEMQQDGKTLKNTKKKVGYKDLHCASII